VMGEEGFVCVCVCRRVGLLRTAAGTAQSVESCKFFGIVHFHTRDMKESCRLCGLE
jgi:hypothetical protein